MQPNSIDQNHAVATEAGRQYLSFFLGGEVYGVDILRVQEIRGWEPVRTLPDAPLYMKGVLDLRGTIVPVFDLRVRFDLPDPEYSATTVVIVINVRGADGAVRVVGAVVDAVSDVLDVLDVTGRDIKPAPDLGGCIGSCYLDGMVTVEERMVILLDIDQLFDVRELNLFGSQ